MTMRKFGMLLLGLLLADSISSTMYGMYYTWGESTGNDMKIAIQPLLALSRKKLRGDQYSPTRRDKARSTTIAGSETAQEGGAATATRTARTAFRDYSLTVDIVSVGSKHRRNLHTAQERTFGSHPVVRNFIPVTENDDDDPYCADELTLEDTIAISDKCRRPGELLIADRIRKHFSPPRRLRHKAHAAGWMCAQKRPAMGFLKAMKMYEEGSQREEKELASIFPDYLVIIDDDTYYNMEIFASYFAEKQNSPDREDRSDGVTMVTPCLFSKPFPYPHGGFGSIWPRGLLQILLQPIRCEKYNASTAIAKGPRNQCAAILEENSVGERQVFQEGMNLVELLEAYTKKERFVDYKNWTLGFCMHSDMVWGWLLDLLWKRISIRYKAKVWDIAFDAVEQKEQDSVLCSNEFHHCDASQPVCHYQNASNMMKYFNEYVLRHGEQT